MTKTSKNTVWVLTSSYNDYDQHGDYFEAVWLTKPTTKQLVDFFTKPRNGSRTGEINHLDPMAALSFILHLENGGGRRNNEDRWYNLNEVEPE